MNCMDLFAGIGGFALAERWMGWETKVCVEIDPYCQRILKHHFPKSEIHGDIKTFDGTKYRGTIDLITGGFPCQPFSSAGKRKGTSDDRYLWPEMLRVIREVAPRWIVGENVRGLVNWSGGLVFEQVCADLEAEGYEVQPFILPACGVNAPHRRDRIWFVAHSNRVISGAGESTGFCGTEKPQSTLEKKRHNSEEPCNTGDLRTTPNSGGQGRKERQQIGGWENEKENGARLDVWSKRFGENGPTPNSDTSRRKEQFAATKSIEQESCSWIPSTQWDNWPTVPPVRTINDGLSSNMVRSAIKGAGNAIVPQVVYQIFKAIEQYEG